MTTRTTTTPETDQDVAALAARLRLAVARLGRGPALPFHGLGPGHDRAAGRDHPGRPGRRGAGPAVQRHLHGREAGGGRPRRAPPGSGRRPGDVDPSDGPGQAPAGTGAGPQERLPGPSPRAPRSKAGGRAGRGGRRPGAPGGGGTVNRVRHALATTFRSLEVRNYRLYFFGQIVSITGTWMQSVGQAWLMLQLTGSAVALGTVTALQFLPILLLGPWGGVVADRFDKRRLLVLTQSTSAALAMVLGVLVATGVVEPWMVYVLALLLGTVTLVDMPARQSFVI